MVTVTTITVTWNETYKAEFGNTRLVYRGECTFKRQDDAELFVSQLNDPNEVSIFDGRENRIEDVVVTESKTSW